MPRLRRRMALPRNIPVLLLRKVGKHLRREQEETEKERKRLRWGKVRRGEQAGEPAPAPSDTFPGSPHLVWVGFLQNLIND